MAIRQALIYCSMASVIAIITTIYPNELKTSQRGLELIASFENCISCTYQDHIGIPTIGIGSTRDLNGKPPVKGKVLSDDEVARLFMRDIKVAEQCVDTHFNGERMPQSVYDMVVSKVYNNGCYGARWNPKANRPTHFNRFAKAGDWYHTCERLADFVHAGGKKSQGLINRAAKEQKECLRDL